MTKPKKILITTDSREIFILRAKGKSEIRGFCADCGRETEMLSLDEAVSFSGIRTLEICRQISEGGGGKIHFLETASGHLLVCRDSLKEGFRLKEEI